MTQMKTKANLDRLRGYSSIFSSNYFTRLMKHNDYSKIDNHIDIFDKSEVGKSFDTYLNYLEFIYAELRKEYRNEYVYKNTFISEFLLNVLGTKDTIAVNEFRVGNSVADIVLFNGTSQAYEIKTELDSNKRLNSQLTDYKKIFKESYIVTHEKLTHKYLQEDESVGVIELRESKRKLRMVLVRSAKENTNIDAETLIHSIRTEEYKNIVKEYYGELPEMNSFNMFEICKGLIKQIPDEQLNSLFIKEIKKRKSNSNIIKTFNKELRQLALAMNFNTNKYNELVTLLDKPIRI